MTWHYILLLQRKVQQQFSHCCEYPTSAKWSHPSRFCHWCPLFGDNGYPPFKSTTQNQNLFLRKNFYFLPTQAQKTHLLQLGIHGNPAKLDLRKIMGKIRYHYFQNWHLEIVHKTNVLIFSTYHIEF